MEVDSGDVAVLASWLQKLQDEHKNAKAIRLQSYTATGAPKPDGTPFEHKPFVLDATRRKLNLSMIGVSDIVLISSWYSYHTTVDSVEFLPNLSLRSTGRSDQEDAEAKNRFAAGMGEQLSRDYKLTASKRQLDLDGKGIGAADAKLLSTWLRAVGKGKCRGKRRGRGKTTEPTPMGTCRAKGRGKPTDSAGTGPRAPGTLEGW